MENKINIDDEKINELIELSTKEYPDIDPYFIWVVSYNYLLNEQGVNPDEELVQKLRDERSKELKYDIRVEG